MESNRRIECKVCRGLNEPGNRFCAFCGASLREQGYKETGGKRASTVAVVVLKRFVFVVIILAVLGGLYYGVSRYLLPIIHPDQGVAEATTGTTVLPSTTSTTLPPRVDRVIAGKDRYATAIAISKSGFTGGAAALVLAGGDAWSGAVCAAPLAAAYNGPVLLVPADGLRADLSEEIQRLNPTKIYLVGVSRSTRVRSQLQDLLNQPDITVLSGSDPPEVAARIAEEILGKLETVDKVVIAPEDSFAEAVAVAPLAAANGWPVLLAPKEGSLPDVTSAEIERLGVKSALVVGTSVKPALADVEAKLGVDIYDTCALIAAYAAANGLSYAHTAIATGEDFPDGLAAGSYLARDKGILLLGKNAELPTPVLTLFQANSASIRKLDFIGLPGLAAKMAVPGSATTTTSSAQVGLSPTTAE
jgi:putative cell wall-binding protein